MWVRVWVLRANYPSYRDTSLIRNTLLLRPYSRTIPRVLWWSGTHMCVWIFGTGAGVRRLVA